MFTGSSKERVVSLRGKSAVADDKHEAQAKV
jgi:hypothetical protein